MSKITPQADEAAYFCVIKLMIFAKFSKRNIMRYLLLSLFSLLLFAACNNDDDDLSLANTLHHDGVNQSSPVLPAGVYEAGARFTMSQSEEYIGRDLERVNFFMGELPTQCEIRIYAEGNNESPGSLLYSRDVTDELEALSWNVHQLSTPIEITGDDIWICVRLVHQTSLRSIGCDPGPAVQDGDWLFQDCDNDWRPFNQRTNISINWNIRGVVARN